MSRTCTLRGENLYILLAKFCTLYYTAYNFDNVCVETDAAENIKLSKKHSTEIIDGAVASVMALDRTVRNAGQNQGSVYDNRGIIVF